MAHTNHKKIEMVEDEMGTFIKEEYKKVIMYMGIVLGVYIGIRYLLPLVGPFVIAFFIVAQIYPYVKKINEKLRINKVFLTGFLLFFIVLLLAAGCFWICNKVVCFVAQMASNVDSIQVEFSKFISQFCECLESRTGLDADDIEIFFLNKVTIISNNIQNEIAPKLMGRSVTYMRSVISVFASIVVTFIATMLLVKDYEKIQTRLFKQKYFLPIFSLIKKIGHLLAIFIKAQAIIMATITIISGSGFWILGQSNPLLLGVITSFLDVLPFIGTGIILVPFALYTVVQGNILQAAGFILLYAICALAREFLEPKLIGDRIGIYPFGVLLSIYAGIKLFGFAGILLGPIMMLFIVEIFRTKNQLKC